MKYFQIHLTIPKTTSSSSCVDWETKPKIFLLAVNENPTSTSLSLFDFHISLSLISTSLSLSRSLSLFSRRQQGGAASQATREARAAARAASLTGGARGQRQGAAAEEPQGTAAQGSVRAAPGRRKKGVFELGFEESANWIGFRILQERIGEKQIVVRGKNPRNS